jgi:predicted alpha/beta-hydrolase family hydrolase
VADTVSPAGLILFHGAGGDREHHTFLALEAELDLPVARINFPYRQKGPGRRPPDRVPRLLEAAVGAAAELSEAWGVDPGQLVLGGRSMGGRVASMAVADGLPAAGLVLLSYPLHPPGRPDKLRVEHLDRIRCPVLLVHGRRDPFGTVEELDDHLSVVPGPVETSWIDANHSPKVGLDAGIVATVAGWLRSLGS